MDPPPRDKLGGDPIEMAGLFEGDIAGVSQHDVARKGGTKGTFKVSWFSLIFRDFAFPCFQYTRASIIRSITHLVCTFLLLYSPRMPSTTWISVGRPELSLTSSLLHSVRSQVTKKKKKKERESRPENDDVDADRHRRKLVWHMHQGHSMALLLAVTDTSKLMTNTKCKRKREEWDERRCKKRKLLTLSSLPRVAFMHNNNERKRKNERTEERETLMFISITHFLVVVPQLNTTGA